MRERLLGLARGGLAALEASRQRVDDLNVFPVPDGDTGTNLVLTVRAVVESLERSQADDRDSLAAEVTRASLMGARGNSGVILSQAIRGAADALRGSDDLARALRGASDTAYAAVREPVEGTILTALRELADEAGAGGDLAAIVARGDDCVARTTGMLPALKDAGVVDAGAAGLVELVRGIAAALTGAPLPASPVRARVLELGDEAIHREPSRYRYCTVFVVEGDALDPLELERELEALGDSLLVVGDRSAVKAHVHTDDPGRALSLGVGRGTISGVEIANMHAQTAERERRLAAAPAGRFACEVVVVAAGAGNRRIFESFVGVRVVDGGRTMNPSTADLLAALDVGSAVAAVLLPNDANVLMAAEHAAAAATRPVRVVPTVSQQAGLTAIVAFDPAQMLDENVRSMERALAQVVTGAVTVASRDVTTNGVAIRRGLWLGLADGLPVVAGESFDDVARAVLGRLLEQPRTFVTLLTGEEPPPPLDGLLAGLGEDHPEVEIEVKEGGQPHYPLLLSAE